MSPSGPALAARRSKGTLARRKTLGAQEMDGVGVCQMDPRGSPSSGRPQRRPAPLGSGHVSSRPCTCLRPELALTLSQAYILRFTELGPPWRAGAQLLRSRPPGHPATVLVPLLERAQYLHPAPLDPASPKPPSRRGAAPAGLAHVPALPAPALQRVCGLAAGAAAAPGRAGAWGAAAAAPGPAVPACGGL